MRNRLAITCGDPAGVGPEIVAAWLAANPADAQEVALVGPARWLDSLPEAAEKIPVGLPEFEATPGRPDGEGSLVAWAALERAAEGCRAGSFAGVVTGRSEEHTSELQSLRHLVCRLLLEKKKV